jgi:hypothetical protein
VQNFSLGQNIITSLNIFRCAEVIIQECREYALEQENYELALTEALEAYGLLKKTTNNSVQNPWCYLIWQFRF